MCPCCDLSKRIEHPPSTNYSSCILTSCSNGTVGHNGLRIRCEHFFTCATSPRRWRNHIFHSKYVPPHPSASVKTTRNPIPHGSVLKKQSRERKSPASHSLEIKSSPIQMYWGKNCNEDEIWLHVADSELSQNHIDISGSLHLFSPVLPLQPNSMFLCTNKR